MSKVAVEQAEGQQNVCLLLRRETETKYICLQKMKTAKTFYYGKRTLQYYE